MKLTVQNQKTTAGELPDNAEVVDVTFAEQLEAENAKLREALTPFVRRLDGLKPDAMTQDVWRDYRIAKAALGESVPRPTANEFCDAWAALPQSHITRLYSDFT